MKDSVQKRWRIRAICTFDVSLQTGEYEHNSSTVRVSQLPQNPVPPNQLLLDLFIEAESDILATEIFVRGYDILNEFLDRVALAGCSPAVLNDILSAVPTEVAFGEEFDLANSYAVVDQGSPIVTPKDLALVHWKEPDSLCSRTFRLLRLALSAPTVEEHYLKLYSVLEQIAEEETTERILQKCPNCKHEVEGSLATANYIRKLIKEAGGDENLSTAWRKLRGKVAHGGGLRNKSFLDELTKAIGGVEAVCIGLIGLRCGAQVRRKGRFIVGFPLVNWRCVAKADGTFKYHPSKWSVRVAITGLANQPQPAQSIGIAWSSGTGIHPLAWPDVVTHSA